MPSQCPELTIAGFSGSFYSCRLKNNLTAIGVMFKIGKENTGLAKLWSQIPYAVGAPVLLKARMIPSEMVFR